MLKNTARTQIIVNLKKRHVKRPDEKRQLKIRDERIIQTKQFPLEQSVLI